MKNQLFYILAGLFLFSSCEKVIELDLKDSPPAIVIEAPLYKGVNDFYARITQSGSYFDNAALSTIEDAVVVITDELGNSTTLNHIGEGIYRAPDFEAIEGSTYFLNVEALDKVYSASAYLPFAVPIDTLRFEYEPESAFGDEGYVLYTAFKDPLDVENYYQLKVTVNGVPMDAPADIFLFDDKFTDGNVIDIPQFTTRHQLGEMIDVELVVMDEEVHDYWTTLTDIIAGQGSAAPANPNTNWDNGALGYFGAFSSDVKTTVVAE